MPVVDIRLSSKSKFTNYDIFRTDDGNSSYWNGRYALDTAKLAKYINVVINAKHKYKG